LEMNLRSPAAPLLFWNFFDSALLTISSRSPSSVLGLEGCGTLPCMAIEDRWRRFDAALNRLTTAVDTADENAAPDAVAGL